MHFTRRQALQTLAGTAIASTVAGQIPTFAQATAATSPMAAPTKAPSGPFVLPPLPYAYDALEPHIDTETMHLHHDKHHAGYVNKLNEALVIINADRAKANQPPIATYADLEHVLKYPSQAGGPTDTLVVALNNGGGHYNHSLFWQTLSPKGGTPTGEFAKALETDLGGIDKLKQDMNKLGGKLFGSGWVWLALDANKKMILLNLPNQDSPLGQRLPVDNNVPDQARCYPLFGIDVWEHAYYLKYHNVRADYLAAIWNVVNWDFISDRYAAAMKA